MSKERITDFYRLRQADRVRVLASRGLISTADSTALLAGNSALSVSAADKMIENVIGVFGLPFAIAPNFLVNGETWLVPMVVEEPSIVAGVSSAAKLAWASDGFRASSTDPLLIGQIQLIDVAAPDVVIQKLLAAEDDLVSLANASQPRLVARGGGAQAIECFKHALTDGRWTVVLHLLVDTRDAMGANIVNTMCENLAADVERLSGANVCLKILSNLADRALVTATVTVPAAALARGAYSGEQVRDRIVVANELALADPYRAATHNKGIMNGIDAVAIATGNDWRSIEAGAHAYAARNGTYRGLTSWVTTPEGELHGTLQMPLKVGIVGGSQSSNPSAAIGLRIAGTNTAQELAELMGAVGLAQNLAALRALASDGIQKGHMSLHARSVAAAAGASAGIFDQVVAGMIESGDVKPWKAAELIDSLQASASATGDENAAHGEAAGKVILLGEHAAVYGKRVVAIPIESGITARIAPRAGGTRISIPDWGINVEVQPGADDLGGVAAILEKVMQHFEVADGGFDILLRSRIPLAMGLGSSAALAVALIRAFNQLHKSGLSDEETGRLAFECEKISHGTPSGIDNHIATFAQPILFRGGDAPLNERIELTEVPPLVVAASGIRGRTLEQVAGVRERRDKSPALYATIFDEIDQISAAGASALARGDYAELGALMNVCHGLLNAIEVSIVELENMVAIARNNGAIGAKLTGAGGGGSIVALCPGSESKVAEALQSAGYQIVTMNKQ